MDGGGRVDADENSGTVDFWFDPSCPYTWNASVWLWEVAQRRALVLRWHLMSLAVLNEDRPVPPEHREPLQQGRRALRVLAAAEEYGGNDALADLYRVLGTRRHENGVPYNPALLCEAVREAGLPDGIAAAADEERHDDAVRASHEAAQRRIGTAAGSPILALAGQRGFFGPVVDPAPTGEQADSLLEAIRLLTSVTSFSELKTARTPR